MINLTAQERDKFAAYCRQEAESANQMAEASAKIGPPGGNLGDVIAKKYRTEAAAHAIVGKYLSSGEEMEIR